MTVHPLTFAPTGLTRAKAKLLARGAYDRAKASGGLAAVLLDRLWSDTLIAIERQPAATATEILRRTEQLFVLIEDRTRWPRG